MTPVTHAETEDDRHIVLLGDSIFDNAAYTRGEPDVAGHLRRLLPGADRVTLLAVDGATMGALPSQLARVPGNATHLVLSIGGNDALGHTDLLDTPVRSTADALRLFAERLDPFERGYRHALAVTLALGKPVVVCTVYNGAFDSPVRDLTRVALSLFNDVILRAAAERAVGVIELRHICTDPEHYANPIEPSGSGGRAIARAIERATRHRVACGQGNRKKASKKR